MASSNRHKVNKDKLDTEIFELCMEYVLPFYLFVTFYSSLISIDVLIIWHYNSMRRDLWMCIDQERKDDYSYFDSFWFNMYINGNDKLNVLKWIKVKKIFSRRYVFVPIIAW